jgi:hypothetical protein
MYYTINLYTITTKIKTRSPFLVAKINGAMPGDVLFVRIFRHVKQH